MVIQILGHHRFKRDYASGFDFHTLSLMFFSFLMEILVEW
jgi:hypothetical protein